MKQRLASLLAILGLLVGVLATAPAAIAGTDTTGFCTTFSQNWAGTGRTTYSDQNGTKAQIDVGSGAAFNPCTDTANYSSFATGWISITSPGLDGGGQPHLFQGGIIVCKPSNGVPSGVCQGASHPRYFFAISGCNNGAPNPQDLGAATYGPHTYKLLKATSGNWEFWVDSTRKLNLIPTDFRFGCWIGNTGKTSQWQCERTDFGASCGSSGYPMTFTGMQVYRTSTGAWANITSTPGCSLTSGNNDTVCSKSSATTMQIYNT
jgi:hypothetical protein